MFQRRLAGSRVSSPGDGGSVSQLNIAGSTATIRAMLRRRRWGRIELGRGPRLWLRRQCYPGRRPEGANHWDHVGNFGRRAGLWALKPERRGGAGTTRRAPPPRRFASRSPGSDGNVTQSNTVGSSATSGNSATTNQGAMQDAAGSAIQVLGQEAATGQGSFAGSLAAQFGASNQASPVRVRAPVAAAR